MSSDTYQDMEPRSVPSLSDQLRTAEARVNALEKRNDELRLSKEYLEEENLNLKRGIAERNEKLVECAETINALNARIEALELMARPMSGGGR